MPEGLIHVRSLPEVPLSAIQVADPFWVKRGMLNSRLALPYQWQQLERVGTIDNFRIVAGIKNGFRRGFFYTDSDAYKWSEAASRTLASEPDGLLAELLDEFIEILGYAQAHDGYLFTFNQFHFPGTRWVNLQIESELYCIGHLIEAAVAHYTATGRDSFISIGVRAADLIIKDFGEMYPEKTPGHEEIELALIRLFRVTGNRIYLDQAARFVENRGRTGFFGFKLIRQNGSHIKRLREIDEQRELYPGAEPPPKIDLAMHLEGRKVPLSLHLRSLYQLFTGKYFQQHTPVRNMREPVGHAVRWAYLMTAAAMLCGEKNDDGLLETLMDSWEHMVRKKMYVTGGVGSLHMVEGFGRDYELDNSWAYCETCAAIGSILWSWEMLRITKKAQYADLIEWQLYNAASAGISLDGRSYLYYNPLESSGNVIREGWFDTACCPGNISRLWASVEKYIYSVEKNELWVHQFIGNNTDFTQTDIQGSLARVEMISQFPWNGLVKMEFHFSEPSDYTIHVRIPSWSNGGIIILDGESVDLKRPAGHHIDSAAGYSPYGAYYHSLSVKGQSHVVIEAAFSMKPQLHWAHRRVRNNRGKVSLSRGPLMYCREEIDCTSRSFDRDVLDVNHPITESISDEFSGGVRVMDGKSLKGDMIRFIPYYCWANREPSRMEVWVRCG